MSKEFQGISSVITDASCFILFDNIGCMPILHQLYTEVITTQQIAGEYGRQLPEWVSVRDVKNKELLYFYAKKVDIGEASAIALALRFRRPY